MELTALLKLSAKDFAALTLFCMLGLLAACLISDPVWAFYAFALVSDHLFLGWLVFLRDKPVERSMPVVAIVGVHFLFFLLVMGLVVARDHIPRFWLLPIPLTAIGLFILSSAAGVETGVDGRRRLASMQLSSGSEPGISANEEAIPLIPPSRPRNALASAAYAEPRIHARHEILPAEPQRIPAERSFAPVSLPAEAEIVDPFPSEPILLRDNSIADSLRPKHSEQILRLNPILAATAEDNEDWIKERGVQNPTHRKIGLSVKEEYEEWLAARVQTRNAPTPPVPARPVEREIPDSPKVYTQTA
jgi:hypothetical protein